MSTSFLGYFRRQTCWLFLHGQTSGSHSDLHEKGEPLVFLLLTLDELQCRWQVTAESSYCILYLLLFLTTKLEDRRFIKKTKKSINKHSYFRLKSDHG